MKKLFELKKTEKSEKRRKPPGFLVPAAILTAFVAAGGAGYLKSVQDAANHVTVSFETNGGQDISSVVVDKGEAMENVPLASKEDSVFESWWYDEQLTQPYFDDDKLEKDTMLYASYQESEEEDENEVYVADNLYLEDCDASAPLVIHSEDEITEDNLSDYLTVDSYHGDIPEGFTVTSLGNGDYEVVPEQAYQEGCTYDFTVLNGASFVSEEGENITEISQRIHKDESEVVELKNDIVYLDWDDVIRNGSDYKLYIPKSNEYTLTENTPLCMIDGYNEWIAAGSDEETFAELFEENSLFITAETVSCDFLQHPVGGQTVSGDKWYYVEARDGELADILSEVDVYEEFEVNPEEMLDIEALEQEIAESEGIRQM
ncbi:MAG: InlB B-repeat-containing protein [Ruminococcus sp.]